MLFSTFLSIACLFISSLGHTVDNSDSNLLDEGLSLPDLVQVNNLPATWSSGESAKLVEGRVMLTPNKASKGSLWAKKDYSLSKSFSLEWTVRSVNYEGRSKGGMALWFLASQSPADKALFNGPSNFDGLQLLIANGGELGPMLRGQLNDGTDSFTEENVFDKSFASCLLAYQDSTVPLTIRLAYDSSDDHLLKVQVDNRVCFQTRKAMFPQGQYKIGVTASNGDNNESFEVLEFKFFDGIVEDVLIPNVNPMEQPRLLTRIVNGNTGEEELVEKTPFEVSGNTDSMTNFELFKKLNKLEGKVLANDIGELSETVTHLVAMQKEQIKKIDHLVSLIDSLTSAKNKDKDLSAAEDDTFQDFFNLNRKLETLLSEQEKIREATKNNIIYNANNSGGPHIDDVVRKLTMWLIPLVIIMMVMAYYTFRIRQDIVKTKLL